VGRLQEGKSADRLGAIQQLRPWHKSMARMAIVGKRPSYIAEVFGMSVVQVSKILGSPLFIAELERLEAQAEYNAVDVRSELEMRQGMAIEAIDRGLQSGDTKVAVNTGFEILDRTGFGKKSEPQKSLHAHLHLHKEVKDMSEEELAEEAQKLLAEEG